MQAEKRALKAKNGEEVSGEDYGDGDDDEEEMDEGDQDEEEGYSSGK